MIGVVGDDEFGDFILRELAARGVDAVRASGSTRAADRFVDASHAARTAIVRSSPRWARSATRARRRRDGFVRRRARTCTSAATSCSSASGTTPPPCSPAPVRPGSRPRSTATSTRRSGGIAASSTSHRRTPTCSSATNRSWRGSPASPSSDAAVEHRCSTACPTARSSCTSSVPRARSRCWRDRRHDRRVRADVPEIEGDLVDTVGAGDSLAAGFLAGRLSGLPMSQSSPSASHAAPRRLAEPAASVRSPTSRRHPLSRIA